MANGSKRPDRPLPPSMQQNQAPAANQQGPSNVPAGPGQGTTPPAPSFGAANTVLTGGPAGAGGVLPNPFRTEKTATGFAQQQWQINTSTIIAMARAATPSQYWKGTSTALNVWNEAVDVAAAMQKDGTNPNADPYAILASWSDPANRPGASTSGGYSGPSGPTPQELAQQRRQFRAEIRKAANTYGIGMSRKQVARLAEIQQKKNLSSTEVTNRLVKHLEMPESGDLSGTAGTVQDQLGTWAKSNGIALGDNQIINYAKDIIKGKNNIDGIKADIRKTYMAGAYPAWADRIAAGEDIADIAAPYMNTAAKLLEVDNVSLDDPTIKQGLQSVGQDGKPRVMPLYEFEQKIRKDPRWQYTDNAKTTYSRAVDTIARTFGMA